MNVVYIWRKFVSFYGYVHWRVTTEISVMYGSEKVKVQAKQFPNTYPLEVVSRYQATATHNFTVFPYV